MVGRILSVNDGSITIEVRQAGAQGASPTVTSQIVLIGTSTRIVKTVETDIKLTDLKANDQVTIVGTTDASGNVSATAILAGGNALQGVFGGPGGARGASPSPSPSARP
jgi:phage baseplate assembly protein gpV